MEFLGGEYGAHLNFASDATSSQIPLPLPDGVKARVEQQEGYPLPTSTSLPTQQTQPKDPHDWYSGTDHWVDESVLMQDLDDMVFAASGLDNTTTQQISNTTVADSDIPPLPDFNDTMAMPDFNLQTDLDVPSIEIEWTDADIAALTAAVAPVGSVPFPPATGVGGVQAPLAMMGDELQMQMQMQMQDVAMPDLDVGFDDMEFDSVFDFEAAHGE